MKKGVFFFVFGLCLLVEATLSPAHAAQKKPSKEKDAAPKVHALAVVTSIYYKLLATAGTEKTGEGANECVIRIWDLDTLKLKHTLLAPVNAVTSLAYNTDGTLLLAGDDQGGLTAWNLKARIEKPHSVNGKGPIRTILFQPGDEDAIVVGDQYYVWNPEPEQRVHRGKLHTTSVVDIDFNFGGALMAACGGRETVIVHPGTFEVLQRFGRHVQPVTAVALSQEPEELFMATGHKNGGIEYWHAGQGIRQGVLRAHKGEVTHLAFYGQDQKLVSAGADGQIRFWDLTNGRPLRTISSSKSSITAFGITQDRKVIATSDGSVIQVRTLDPENPKQIAQERTLDPFAASQAKSQ
jgi:WD40 repeat protein